MTQPTIRKTEVWYLLILHLLYVHAISLGQVDQNPSPKWFGNVNCHPASDETTQIIKLNTWRLLINLVRYWKPPLILPQIEGKI
jgi:hypothetical protein